MGYVVHISQTSPIREPSGPKLPGEGRQCSHPYLRQFLWHGTLPMPQRGCAPWHQSHPWPRSSWQQMRLAGSLLTLTPRSTEHIRWQTHWSGQWHQDLAMAPASPPPLTQSLTWAWWLREGELPQKAGQMMCKRKQGKEQQKFRLVSWREGGRQSLDMAARLARSMVPGKLSIFKPQHGIAGLLTAFKRDTRKTPEQNPVWLAELALWLFRGWHKIPISLTTQILSKMQATAYCPPNLIPNSLLVFSGKEHPAQESNSANLVQPAGGANGRFLPVPHLKTRNSKSSSIIWSGSGWYHKRAVRDVLVIKLHRNLIVTCKRKGAS